MTLLTEKAETAILKTDVLGRVWTPREKREELVAEYERSAMSAVEFAKWSGVKYGTFAGWVAKVRKGHRQGGKEGPTVLEAKPMRWAEAVCEAGAKGSEAALMIHLGDRIRVEANNGRVAAELLAALGVRVC